MRFLVAAEGLCDLAAIQKLLEDRGHEIEREFNCRGKGNLNKRLSGFVAAADHFDWFILRDLDRDASCAPELIAQLVRGGVPPRMVLRIAVRTLETWLFADRVELARWLHVSQNLIPRNPEALPDPKSTLANVASRSRDRSIRERMAPDPHSGASVGPEYEAALLQFIRDVWSPRRAIASEASDSLCRAANALQGFRAD